MNAPIDREVAVFSAARRLAAGERAAYLDETCAGDAALRQRVENLLRASEEAETFLQSPALGAQRSLEDLAPANPLPNVTAPGERAGDRIGRYKLLQQIGEGGCGVVYMAEMDLTYLHPHKHREIKGFKGIKKKLKKTENKPLGNMPSEENQLFSRRDYH